jgi:hypothetical protein
MSKVVQGYGKVTRHRTSKRKYQGAALSTIPPSIHLRRSNVALRQTSHSYIAIGMFAHSFQITSHSEGEANLEGDC